MKKHATPKLKKQATNILEKARRIMGITRDQYAFCQYVHYRCADPRQKISGWCCDLKEEIGDFVGISRVGVHKMARAMEQSGLVSISTAGYYQVTETWIDIESDCKQSLHKDGKEDVNFVYTGRKQSLQIEREKRKQSLHTPYSIDNKELEGERTPPTPNPSTSKEEKKENGLVAPAENPETEESEIPPSKKVAPKKDSPEEECPMCEGKGGWYNRFTEGHETCPACHGEGKIIFEATAIASPTDIPGVTLVEATTKTIQPWEYPNPQSPKELKTILLRYANQNQDNWRDNVLESGRATNWPAEKVDECLTDFCAWQFQQDSTRGKLSQYTAGFSLWLKRQPRYDSMNAPKDGGQTRGNQTQRAGLNGFGADPIKYQEKPLF